ncbi:MAG TPA: hypothetical protein VMZ28_23940 [Kofleriaceae bacterium]|nr:hypothetical protein [Kofleriaceae bacterium]
MGPALTRRSGLAVALGASLLAHLLLVGAVVLPDDSDEEEADPFTVLDLDIAPPPPEGFDPADDRPAAEVVEEPPPPEPAAPDETTMEPEPAPEPEPEVAVPIDAGVPDAAPRRADAGDQTAENDATGDAGPPHDAGPEVAATSTGDAGPTSGTTGPLTGVRVPPGAAADFRRYAPDGDKVAVLLRYDRLRGTAWAPLADAILAPMPDHRSIVGDRKVAMTELFDTLLISSRNPTDVVATNLIARVRKPNAETRRFLDNTVQRVKWKAVRGGVLGKRQPSAVKLERDSREYLMPWPNWVVLTRSKHLGAAARSPRPDADTVDLDKVQADDAALPAWLQRARSIEAETGDDTGPIAVVSVGGIVSTQVTLPQVGTLPTPQTASLALEMATTGFFVRGTLIYDTPEHAQALQEGLEAARTRLLDSRLGELLLKNFHAYHALKGLTLRRRGTKVTYATSISNADAKAMMELAADWARRFYAAQEDAPAPEPPSPSQPPGKTPPAPAPPP